MSAEIQKFGGEPYLKLCTHVCAYWTGPIADRRDAIMAFYLASLPFVEARLKWYQTETMEIRSPMTLDTLGLFGFWLSDERAQRSFMGLELEGGDDPDLPSDASFTFKSIRSDVVHAGVCRLVLPVHVGLSESDRLLRLALELFSVPGFTYGTSGFAVNWNPRSDVAPQAKQQFPYIAKRYLGIDIPHLTATLLTVSRGIKCIDWLTMLNQPLWEMAQGEQQTDSRIDGSFIVHALPGGVMLQAGPKPSLGDTYRSDLMDDYQAVGEALASIRAQNHPAIIPGPDEETAALRTEEWLARFDY